MISISNILERWDVLIYAAIAVILILGYIFREQLMDLISSITTDKEL